MNIRKGVVHPTVYYVNFELSPEMRDVVVNAVERFKAVYVAEGLLK